MKLALGLGLVLLAAAAGAEDNAVVSTGPVQAHVVSVEGEAFLFTHDAPDEAIPLEEGAPLDEGDRVETEKDGHVEIGLEDQGVISLAPDSDMTISALDRQEPSFSLAAGRLLAKVKAMFAPEGRLSVHTPTAVAAIRGTEFGVDFDESANESHVGVFDEGKVAVTPPEGGHELLLHPNEETLVQRGQAPLRAQRLQHFLRQRARIQRLRGRIQFLRAHWRRLPPGRRLALRQQLRARLRAMPPAKRERIRRRIQARRQRRQARRARGRRLRWRRRRP